MTPRWDLNPHLHPLQFLVSKTRLILGGIMQYFKELRKSEVSISMLLSTNRFQNGATGRCGYFSINKKPGSLWDPGFDEITQ